MGDSERWPEASGLSPEGSHSFTAAFATFLAKGDEWWARAELRAAELITSVQPNQASEERRQAVVDYVKSLIQSCVNCQVVTFGSVPLKTYLPDGDIDLTAFSHSPDAKRSWIQDVHNILQKEKENPNSEFRVKEVQLIHAEVKIVKCFVENILVDVSFDQLGGVCTLCFLEEVDRLVGESHLFKRSIILVKAWCYYESRILGAHCGLMSTYALETLVLYIFHIFHASLRGPLQVLYLFLEFFSSFDWDKYCVSLSSPILLASLSEVTGRQSIVVEDLQKLALLPWREGGELLFTKAFFDACETTYGLVPGSQVAKSNKFIVKYLNISDPLRSSNNLGRSVNQGNFARIRRAFVLGARTLRYILNCNETEVSTELDQFFKNCNLRLHGSLQRPDVAGPKSWKTKVSNARQKIAKGDTTSNAERSDCVSHSLPFQNNDHLQLTKLKHVEDISSGSKELPARESSSQETLGFSVEYDGSPVLSAALARDENLNKYAGSPKSSDGKDVALNSRDKKMHSACCASSGSMCFSCHSDEESMSSTNRGDVPVTKRTSLQVVDGGVPVILGPYEDGDLFPGVALKNGSSHESRRGLERRDASRPNMNGGGVLKQDVMENGNHGTQYPTNSSSPSICSRVDSEEDEEWSSQNSSKGEALAFEDSTAIVVPELQGCTIRSPLPYRPETQDQTPSHSEQSVNMGNEVDSGFLVPVELCKQAGHGCEYPSIAEVSQSKVPRRKARAHNQNGLHSKDPEAIGDVVHANKSKRGSGKSKGSWSGDNGLDKVQSTRARVLPQDGDMSVVSSSTIGQSHAPASGYQNAYSPDAVGAPTFITQQSRLHPSAASPRAFRHPLANYQFDPGTLRILAGSSIPCYPPPMAEVVPLGHSSPPQYYYPSYAPHLLFPPGLPYLSMYNPGMNVHKGNSLTKGDGSSGRNGKNQTGHETNELVDVSIDTSGDSPSHKSQPNTNEQVLLGIVERLEAVGISASTSPRRREAVACRGTDGAEPSGRSTELLTSNLQLHLDSLAYGRYCMVSCNPSLSQPVYPTHASDKQAHKRGSWEGPGRPETSRRAQFLEPQFYPTGPSFVPMVYPYVQYPQPFWATRGVELSPRPRGTGTYLPSAHHQPLRQNIRSPPGRLRGGVQNGALQQEDYNHHHHQPREHESNHHLHGPQNHRAPTNREETHAQVMNGYSNKGEEIRSSKLERVRDAPHQQQKQEFTRGASASHSLHHPNDPSVSSLRAISSGEVHNPSELFHADSDLKVPLNSSKPHHSPGPPVVAMCHAFHERKLSSELPSEFISSRDSLLGGEIRSGPVLKRSFSTGCSHDPVTISSLLSTPRSGEQAYQMKEEDFPPLCLGQQRVNHIEIANGGTDSIANGISSNLDRYVSLRCK